MRGDPAALLERLQAQRDPLSQHVLSVHSQSEAGDGDADLRGGDVTVLSLWIFKDACHTPGQAATLSSLMLDGRAWCADNGELRGDEQAVGDHQ